MATKTTKTNTKPSKISMQDKSSNLVTSKTSGKRKLNEISNFCSLCKLEGSEDVTLDIESAIEKILVKNKKTAPQKSKDSRLSDITKSLENLNLNSWHSEDLEKVARDFVINLLSFRDFEGSKDIVALQVKLFELINKQQ